MKRKIGTVAGIIVIIGIIAFANQWTRLNRLSNEHLEMSRITEDMTQQRGKQPTSWDLFMSTQGAFEEEPTFSSELMALEGKRINIVGYGMPLGARHPAKGHEGHNHASVLSMLIPEFILSHAHDKPYQNVVEFMLLRLPLDCYHHGEPILNEIIYGRAPHDGPLEFTSENPISISGELVLNKEEGAKFCHVLRDVTMLKLQ
jgi:hypothetical protein